MKLANIEVAMTLVKQMTDAQTTLNRIGANKASIKVLVNDVQQNDAIRDAAYIVILNVYEKRIAELKTELRKLGVTDVPDVVLATPAGGRPT